MRSSLSSLNLHLDVGKTARKELFLEEGVYYIVQYKFRKNIFTLSMLH